ncbi:MAG: hypothetical protein RR254_08995 [Muribaculaceae bacterium]
MSQLFLGKDFMINLGGGYKRILPTSIVGNAMMNFGWLLVIG